MYGPLRVWTKQTSMTILGKTQRSSDHSNKDISPGWRMPFIPEDFTLNTPTQDDLAKSDRGGDAASVGLKTWLAAERSTGTETAITRSL